MLSPIIYVFIYIIRYCNPKINDSLKKQKKTFEEVKHQLENINRTKKKVLLFHAASVGEFEQLKPILKKINRKEYFIIQSFTSPTIYNLENQSSLFDISCYQPFDFLLKSYKYFSAISPQKYIITRHDIWPTHTLILYLLNIPIYYINANIHEDSIWVKPFIRIISKNIFKKIKLFIVPSFRIKYKLSSLVDENKIIVHPDSRFERIQNRYNKNKNVNLLPNLTNSFNIIFGSYDDIDEQLIFNSLIKTYPKGDQSLINVNHNIILVPHEINLNKINKLRVQFKKNKFESILYTKIINNDKLNNIIIVDKIGILADLYKYAKLAYVGSGFGKGVHSVIEPAIYKCAIGFGPNFSLLDEAKEINENNAAIIISDQTEMLNFIALYNNRNEINRLGEKAFNIIKSKKNIAEKMLEIILK